MAISSKPLLSFTLFWPGATLVSAAACVPAMRHALEELHRQQVDGAAVVDGCLLHDRMVLEALGVLPLQARPSAANACALVSAYVNNDRNWDQTNETFGIRTHAGGLACLLSLPDQASYDCCKAHLPAARPITAKDHALPEASFTLGTGFPQPQIHADITSDQQAKLAVLIPNLPTRARNLIAWQQAAMPEEAAWDPNQIMAWLPPSVPLAHLRCPVPDLAARLQQHALEWATAQAPTARAIPRL